jgi:hypothetical protein
VKAATRRVWILTDADYRQPFDMQAVSTAAHDAEKAARASSAGLSANWLPFVETYRTLCRMPTPEMRMALEKAGKLAQGV